MNYSRSIAGVGLAAALSMTNPSAHAEGVNKYTVDDANREITFVSQQFEAKVLNCLNGNTRSCILQNPLTPEEKIFSESRGLKATKANISIGGKILYDVGFLIKSANPYGINQMLHDINLSPK